MVFATWSCNVTEADQVIPHEEYSANVVSEQPVAMLNVKASLNEKIEYKRYHLQNVARWLSNHMEIVEERSIGRGEEDDESTTFLIEGLVNEYVSKRRSLHKNDYLQGVKSSLDAFKFVDDEKAWFPSVRVIVGKGALELQKGGEVSLIAIEDATEKGKFYQFNSVVSTKSGKDLVRSSEKVTEESLGARIMVLVEITDCMSPYLSDVDQFFECTDPVGDDLGGGGGSGGSASHLRIEKMTIKDLKEGWPGRSEIKFKGYKFRYLSAVGNACGDQIYPEINCYDNSGVMIGKWKRRWRNDERVINWTIKTQNLDATSEYIYYSIFEGDWPAPEQRDYFIFPNGEYTSFTYCSWQSEYHKAIVSQDYNEPNGVPYFNNYTVDNSDIKYNLKRW